MEHILKAIASLPMLFTHISVFFLKKKDLSENPVNLDMESFCQSNLTILCCIYLSKHFVSLWQLHQECLTYVTGKGIMKNKAVNQL